MGFQINHRLTILAESHWFEISFFTIQRLSLAFIWSLNAVSYKGTSTYALATSLAFLFCDCQIFLGWSPNPLEQNWRLFQGKQYNMLECLII